MWLFALTFVMGVGYFLSKDSIYVGLEVFVIFIGLVCWLVGYYGDKE